MQAVLTAICEAAKAVSQKASVSSKMQSFYAVLLCEILLATAPVCDHLDISVSRSGVHLTLQAIQQVVCDWNMG